MTKIALMTVLAMLWLGFNGAVQAEETPIGISIFNPIQFPSPENDVGGLRLNIIYGQHERVHGLDIGLIVNGTSGDQGGAQWGIINYGGGYFHGWQNGVVNIVKGDVVGLQLGLVNYVEGNFCGLGNGLVNITKGRVNGVQLAGVYNLAEEGMTGLQLGLINSTGALDGVQIGLLNFNGTHDPFGFFPIVNVSF